MIPREEIGNGQPVHTIPTPEDADVAVLAGQRRHERVRVDERDDLQGSRGEGRGGS